MFPTPFFAFAFTFVCCDFLVRPKGVKHREVVTAWVSEFSASIRDGISLFRHVKKEVGRGRQQGDDVDYFKSTAVSFRFENDTGKVRFNREGGHLATESCQCPGIVQGTQHPEGFQGRMYCITIRKALSTSVLTRTRMNIWWIHKLDLFQILTKAFQL